VALPTAIFNTVKIEARAHRAGLPVRTDDITISPREMKIHGVRIVLLETEVEWPPKDYYGTYYTGTGPFTFTS
jgi:hypothetical protein